MMQDKINNDNLLDLFTELCSIAVGNAATSLASLLSRFVNVTVNRAKLLQIEDIPVYLKEIKSYDKVHALFFEIVEERTGSIFLLFDTDAVLKITKLLAGETKRVEEGNMNEFRGSILKEIGNIIVANYLSAISKLIKIKLVHSIPHYVEDYLSAIIDGILMNLGQESNEALLVDTGFNIENEQIKSQILFLPDKNMMDIIKKILLPRAQHGSGRNS